MFVHAISEYLPDRVVDNAYFGQLTGKPAEWFERLTGIRTRRRASAHENATTMAVEAALRLATVRPELIAAVDLVIGSSYTPWDTVGTIAHHVQRKLELDGIRALYLSTACSSFLNSLEIAWAFSAIGESTGSLIVCAEHNSGFSVDDDLMSGHLWGDGAAAVLVSTSPYPAAQFEVIDVRSAAFANAGHGPGGVFLEPRGRGLQMPHGKDVFALACRHMQAMGIALLEANGLSLADVALLVPHQANMRIIERVAASLGIKAPRIAETVTTLGNTGSASIPITMSRYVNTLREGDVVLMVAFGGGYSAGAALLRRL